MTPTVSVVMSVFNNARDVGAAVRSMLVQTFADLELVAVDDGSTDGSGELLDKYAARDPRVRVIHQANQGLGPALHTGCLAARGEFIARQDADDLSAPTRLARQVEYLRRLPNVVLCGTWTWFVHPDDGPVGAWEVPDDPRVLRRLLKRGSNPLVHGSVMLRRSAYLLEGAGYRLRRDAEDFDLWLRLSALGDVGCVASMEYLYTINPAGLSFGYLTTRRRVLDLCLRLDAERDRFGRELTDYRSETERIYRGPAPTLPAAHRASAAAYARGIDALRAGRWSAFTRHMRTAARGEGLFARKARTRIRLGALAPLLRTLYFLRLRRSAERYYRYLPSGTALPAYVTATGDT